MAQTLAQLPADLDDTFLVATSATDVASEVKPAPRPLTREQIENRLKHCARLPSLSSINSALRELLGADQRYTTQVAEIIRRDPSLTSRLLRLVNSVYYGLSTPVGTHAGGRRVAAGLARSARVAGQHHVPTCGGDAIARRA